MTPQSRPISPAQPDQRSSRRERSSGRSLLPLIVASGARTCLITVGALLAWGVVPMVLGWHTTTVVTGSMEPRLVVGDLAVSRPVAAGRLRLDQVLLFDDPDHAGRLRLHRLVAVNDNGTLTTRGDANPQNDSTAITPNAVVGVGTLRIPYVGTPRVWVQNRQWIPLLVLAAALAGVMALTQLNRTSRPDTRRPPGGPDRPTGQEAVDEPQPARIPTGPFGLAARSAGPDGHRIRAGVLAAVVAIAVSGAVVGPSSYSAFADTVANPTSKLNAAPYYRCSTAIAANNPSIWYRFDETGGTTTADSSGNSQSGVYRAGTTLGADRACGTDTGTAVTLNGTNGAISSTNAYTVPTTFTAEIWFKTTTARGGLLVGLGQSATGLSSVEDRQLYLTNAGRVSFSVYPNNTPKTITSTKAYNDGKWHHAAATLSTAGIQLYLDGARVAADTNVTSGASYTGYLRIGYDDLSRWTNAPTSNYLAGTLDNAVAYTTALTATDITNHYNTT